MSLEILESLSESFLIISQFSKKGSSKYPIVLLLNLDFDFPIFCGFLELVFLCTMNSPHQLNYHR
jgi:hypothetical protein